LVEHLHGKEGVNGSSPLEGSAKAPHAGGFCVQVNLRRVDFTVGMAPFVELSRRRRARSSETTRDVNLAWRAALMGDHLAVNGDPPHPRRGRRNHEPLVCAVRNDEAPASRTREPHDRAPPLRRDALEFDLEAVARDLRVCARGVAGDGTDDVVPLLPGCDRDQPQPVVRRHNPAGAHFDHECLIDARRAVGHADGDLSLCERGRGSDGRDAQGDGEDPHTPTTSQAGHEVPSLTQILELSNPLYRERSSRRTFSRWLHSPSGWLSPRGHTRSHSKRCGDGPRARAATRTPPTSTTARKCES